MSISMQGSDMKGVLLDKSVYITDTSITRDSMRILLQHTVQITVRYKYKRKKNNEEKTSKSLHARITFSTSPKYNFVYTFDDRNL